MLWLRWLHNGSAFGYFPCILRREVKHDSITRQAYQVGQLNEIFSYIEPHEI